MNRCATSIRALIALALLLVQTLGPGLHMAWGHEHRECAHGHACTSDTTDHQWAAHSDDSCAVCAWIARAHTPHTNPGGTAIAIRFTPTDAPAPHALQREGRLDISGADARAPPR